MSQQGSDKHRPDVIIIGAGIAGLTLAILLEQINIPYHIFERATEVKPLGAAMIFTGNTFPVLEQLGIYEEFKKICKSYNEVNFYDANSKPMGNYDAREHEEITGYPNLIFSRPRLELILRNRVPAHKITFKKKVLSTEEKDGKVTVHFSDNTSHTGDILVGADGAHSGVRQNLYKHMEEKGILPESDKEDFSVGYTTIVGVATPPNPEKYPQLKEEYTKFSQVLFGGGDNCYIATLPNNQIGWGFGEQFAKSSLKEAQSQNPEWSAAANDATLLKYRDVPCPLGGTMGEIFDATPKDLISKVFLEEKMFKTWHYGRTVLLGDACHKFHPAGGQGARNAIEDAVVLANCLYTAEDCSTKRIEAAFKNYFNQRFSRAEEAYNGSAFFSKILNGQEWSERLVRYIALNYIPTWVMNLKLKDNLAFRPQVQWLPLVENRGTGPALPQAFDIVKANDPVDL
ncbi:hypothetical protein BGZ46_006004 [Entomortierella lignicola]|nr:hypothetical protein BGZ46_006004 [Entomortierella lignicola]